MGTLTSYVGALDAEKSCPSGSAGFSWINIKQPDKSMFISLLIVSTCFRVYGLVERAIDDAL